MPAWAQGAANFVLTWSDPGTVYHKSNSCLFITWRHAVSLLEGQELHCPLLDIRKACSMTQVLPLITRAGPPLPVV
jgi:hypothetical protein